MLNTAIKLVWNKKKPQRRRPTREPIQWRAWLPESRDIFLFGGIASAGYGVYQIYPPSAYVLVGGCLIALGVLIYMGGTKN